MMIPGTSSNSLHRSAVNDAEFQLQQELRVLFAVDTQQHLQDYFSLVQRLSAQSWTADIQHIYRAVHTIKGGAVTVEVDAMLHAAMVLEDLLSDLRYLEQSPDLEDGQLIGMLQEAGELLSSTIEISETGAQAIARVQPTVQRLDLLREVVKQRYLPDWSELKQVHQEFAEQGFDLVVLELEMALDRIPAQGSVPAQVVETAQQTLNQLDQIGRDLQFAEGWQTLLQRGEAVLTQPEGTQWRALWLGLFHDLKRCAREGGELSVAPEATALESAPTAMAPEPLLTESSSDFESDWEIDLEQLEIISARAALQPSGLRSVEDSSQDTDLLKTAEPAIDWSDLSEFTSLGPKDWTPTSLEAFDALEGLESLGSAVEDSFKLQDGSEDLLNLGSFTEFNLELDDLNLDDLGGLGDVLNSLEPWQRTEPQSSDLEFAQETEDQSSLTTPEFPLTADAALDRSADTVPAAPLTAAPKRDIQIPVPLERLDHAAQQVVETLLSARSVMDSSQKLQAQMLQLTTLTQESAQFVTRLRQLQDDYALLRNLSDEKDTTNNLTLERYRQGYSTINRLLENILRMSELGQEIETITHQSVSRLDKLDRSILRLKDEIETSRLVPFRNLTLRSRAILRDLTNRYGKPAELIIHGEQVELDAGVIQQLEPLLLHLLRNAYDHGIESVEDRLKQGKAALGTITLTLQRRGNLYRLTLQDDGRGIDAETVRQQAQQKGFALTQTSTPATLLAVLCQPGFSSRSTVSEVSGRGVGMDVVAGQIEAMGGRLSLQTKLTQGTCFTIEVPAPQLLVSCVLLQVGDRIMALPSEEILETVLISSIQADPSEAQESLCTWTLSTHQGEVQGFDLAHYWNPKPNPQAEGRSLPDTAICIRTRQDTTAGQLSSQPANPWLIADDLLSQEDLLINPLPSPLVAPTGLLGFSLQPDGHLISVLDPLSLSEAIQTGPKASTIIESSRPQPVASPQALATILVVDDAALMRRRMEGSLHTYGFTTHTCGDGLEALSWLQTNSLPDLIITDVEMPNMDGFTLIDRCRQSGIEIPILVVSSRLSEEWGREAQRLGANDYLNKGFSTAELIQKINQCLGTAAAV